MRGAAEIAVMLAVLSFVLPGRGIGLAVAAAAVGFVIGLVLEFTVQRRR